MKGLARKRVTLNLKVNDAPVSAFSVVLLWFFVSINNMKKDTEIFPIVYAK